MRQEKKGEFINMTLKRPYSYFPEPYGLPFELTPTGKFRKPTRLNRTKCKLKGRKLQCTISKSYAKELERKYGKGIYTISRCKRHPKIVED